MSSPLTTTQQSKIAGDLKGALISGGHEPVIESNWEPDLELTTGEGSHISSHVTVYAKNRSIKVNDTVLDGAQFTGRGFTDKMVAAVLGAIKAPAAKPKKKVAKAPKKDLGGPPPKRGIRLV